MAFVLADRVKETTTSPGTGTATLNGAATGYRTFSAGIGANNTTYYVIADQGGANWEVGYGTVGAGGTTLARTTVLASSNGGSATNFSSGTQDVWCDYTAVKAVIQNSAGNIQLDFSNATLTSRNSFQTNTTNGSTGIYALPNGTSTAASWQATNAADPTNASKVLIATNGSTDVQLVSGINGTGTYLPLSFYTNGSQKGQINLAGDYTAVGNLVAQNGIIVNNKTVGTSYSIPSGYSAHSAGPITVASGVTVTVPSGSKWVVL